MKARDWRRRRVRHRDEQAHMRNHSHTHTHVPSPAACLWGGVCPYEHGQPAAVGLDERRQPLQPLLILLGRAVQPAGSMRGGVGRGGVRCRCHEKCACPAACTTAQLAGSCCRAAAYRPARPGQASPCRPSAPGAKAPDSGRSSWARRTAALGGQGQKASQSQAESREREREKASPS